MKTDEEIHLAAAALRRNMTGTRHNIISFSVSPKITYWKQIQA
jgi:hypothetical protein